MMKLYIGDSNLDYLDYNYNMNIKNFIFFNNKSY